MAGRARLAARQVGGTEDEPFDALTARERFHDFRDVGQRDTAVKEMVGLDQDANTARALIEAARCAGAGFEPGQTPRGKLFLQSRPNFFRTANRAGALGVIIRPAISADKEIALSQRHAGRLAACHRAVNQTQGAAIFNRRR